MKSGSKIDGVVNIIEINPLENYIKGGDIDGKDQKLRT